jgi:ubiquinone/menaquinone biosynthesis C-methylase UbiE
MLNDSQYASAAKYEARIYLSRRFRTNPQSKYGWIFDHFPKGDGLEVLELGCGTGLFWLANRDRLVKTWTVTLSDYSEGMLDAARKSLAPLGYPFKYAVVDAQDIQYADKTFDIILANNMLYHLPNRDAALHNIRRILKDGGVFAASTMGRNDLLELHNYLYAFLETKHHAFRFREYPFSLDNGREQLAKHFKDVVLEKHDNRLVIKDADAAYAVVNYYLSFNGISGDTVVLPEEEAADFKAYLQNILAKEKTITTQKDEGLFICK